jgi:F420H(2)-dependent quinone reductase
MSGSWSRLWSRLTSEPANHHRALCMDFLSVADRSWPVLRRVMALHTVVYRATHGLVGHRIPGGPRCRCSTTWGRRAVSSAPPPPLPRGRTEPGDPSKGGHPSHPAWFHNLRVSPETRVRVDSERRPVRARVATPDERRRLWPRAMKAYGGYADYQRRTGRQIPLVILEPR